MEIGKALEKEMNNINKANLNYVQPNFLKNHNKWVPNILMEF